MLADELMRISPEAPLSRGGAWRLVSDSLLAGGQDPCVASPLSVGGATGHVLAPEGQPGLSEGPWVCAVGAFDGLHLGHRDLLLRAR